MDFWFKEKMTGFFGYVQNDSFMLMDNIMQFVALKSVRNVEMIESILCSIDP